MKTAVAMVMLVCSAAVAGAQERLADQLRKGIVQEEANQNIEKAIQAYQAIVAQYDQDRQAAATALFRLAECYRKAGRREPAVAAYQRVVREFADQVALVEPSRRQLASTYGLSEPQLARATRAANTREAREQAMQATDRDIVAKLEQEKAYQARIQSAERDMVAVEQRIKAFQAKIKAGVAAPGSAEEFQLQRELEEARRRLEVTRAREREMPPERVVIPTVQREVTPEMLQSTQLEMDALQRRLADMKQRVEVGIASPLDYRQLQAQFDMLALRYQQQLKEREADEATTRETRALNERLIRSVEDEIALLTRWVDAAEKGVVKGYTADSPQVLQVRRELLQLQRKLEELKVAVKR